jgi:hypothetical protein
LAFRPLERFISSTLMLSTATRGRLADAPDLAVRSTGDESIRRQVWSLLAGLYPHGGPMIERRAAQRFAYPQLLHLTTTLADGRSPADRTIVVVGKTLSEGGLGFFHRDPLAERHMIASLMNHDQQYVSFLLDVTWCRFTTLGWYESGGRFLEVVRSPLAA